MLVDGDDSARPGGEPTTRLADGRRRTGTDPAAGPRRPRRRPDHRPGGAADWAERLGSGSAEPVALDAERASGFRYGSRAYLVQLRRADVGTALLDPIALGDLSVLDEPLSRSEWVLHAANQDLPCLAEVGIRPRRLFDTELAGRLAGLPRVGLGPLVEQMLGLHLRKGHGAADWSTRPLPHDWLVYAALDVEVLVELRDEMEALLRRQGKWEWARQEFAAIVQTPPPTPRTEPWRRTSGVHRITTGARWRSCASSGTSRDGIARRRDVAPHRILPDSAIIEAATERPTTVAALTALPMFSGRMQRRNADVWLAAISQGTGPAGRGPADVPATERRSAGAGQVGLQGPGRGRATAGGQGRAGRAGRTGATPVENLLSPDIVRRVLWAPPADGDVVRGAARERGARPWQIELVAPLLRAALDAPRGWPRQVTRE